MTRKNHTMRLFGLALAYKGQLIVALLALTVASGINLLFPEVVRRLFEPQYSKLLFESPLLIGGVLIGLFGIQALAFYIRSFLFSSVGQKAVEQVRKQLFEAIVWQEVGFFDRSRVGDLVSRLSADTLLLQDAVSVKISVFVRYAIQVVFGILLMSFISIQLTLAIVCLLPILVIISMFLGRKLRQRTKAQQAALGDATTIAEESFSSIRIVKAFNRAEYESGHYATAVRRVLQAGLSRATISAFFASFVSFLMNAAIVAVLLFGVTLINAGTLSLGDLTAFLLYGVIVAVSFSFLAGGYTDFVQALGAAERIFEILDQGRVAESPELLSLPTAKEFVIAYDQVGFAYPSRPDVLVLNDISFTLPSGKITALVGPSGSGKSTIVSLLLRFYDPVSGRILLGEHDVREIRTHDLRERIALVPQEPELFAVSLAENLRYGKLEASMEELEKTCDRANILDFIQKLPDGFETNVGHRGIQLSGGQKQRIAIARAMLRDPDILVLDEATSALDSENERLVQQALKNLMQGRTSLVIAHRLSTIKNADQLVVLKSGQVVQCGTHQVLSTEPGLYQQLVQQQELFADVSHG